MTTNKTAAEILATVQQSSTRKVESAVEAEAAALHNLIRHANEMLDTIAANAVYSGTHNKNKLGFLEQDMRRLTEALLAHAEHTEVITAIDFLISKK